MFKGIDHVGIGVSDMEESLEFYRNHLGFKEILFDYSGPLLGLEKITGKPEAKARIVMLQNPKLGPVGLGRIKLVQLLPPDKPEPIPEGIYWGEVGVSEVCITTPGIAENYSNMVLKGAKALMPPLFGPYPPFDTQVGIAYIADPDGGKVELIEWPDMCAGIGEKPRLEGVNHVAFGVSNLNRTKEFYQKLGFTELVLDYDGYNEAMAIWFPKPVKMKMVILANYSGAWIEPVEHVPPSKDLRGSWGHLGPMEFAVGVSNLEKACEALQQEGMKFLSPPQTIEVSSGEWKYAYLVEPDNLYVALVEPRY
jgi:catechol 2,3-dioxygenase-like lactoylglutathione lyase family enzyme